MASDRPIVVVSPVHPADGRGPAPGLAGPIPAARPLKLALLSNGKPNGAELLDQIGNRLRRLGMVDEIRRYRKPSVSVGPEDTDRAEINERADAVITAIGD
jgi:hypothetical protein